MRWAAVDECRSPAGGPSGTERPLETVEKQVEPELELVAVVVAGPERVLERQLGEVRVLVDGELR
jgi:hypothetical protein